MQSSRQGLMALATLAALGLAATPRSAHAQVFTTRAAFTTAMGSAAGTAYTETFTSSPTSLTFTGNGYTYTVSSSGTGTAGVYYSAAGGFIGTVSNLNSLVFTFTSGNVKAVGGNFFGTDFNDAFVASSVTVTLNNGLTSSFSGTSLSDFRGFIASSPITTLTLAPTTPTTGTTGDYASVDNFTVGTAAPEPSQTAALGLGVLGLAGLALKARKRRSVA